MRMPVRAWRGRSARTAHCQAGAWPHTARTSIWWIIIGLFAKSTIGLGTVSVSGRSRVPYPPTRIKAFIARLLVLQGGRAGGPVTCELLVPPLFSFALLIVESFQNSTKCPLTPSSKPPPFILLYILLLILLGKPTLSSFQTRCSYGPLDARLLGAAGGLPCAPGPCPGWSLSKASSD